MPSPRGSPVTRTCAGCPAWGGLCPDCRTEGKDERPDSRLVCQRCRGTGFLELVEISLEEIALLRRDQCRLSWLAGEYARITSSSRSEVIEEIDELLALIGRTARPPAVPLDGRARNKKAPIRAKTDRGQR